MIMDSKIQKRFTPGKPKAPESAEFGHFFTHFLSETLASHLLSRLAPHLAEVVREEISKTRQEDSPVGTVKLSQAADLLGVSRQFVETLCDAGALTRIDLAPPGSGRATYVIELREIEEYKERRKARFERKRD